jgi:hypothetical protein
MLLESIFGLRYDGTLSTVIFYHLCWGRHPIIDLYVELFRIKSIADLDVSIRCQTHLDLIDDTISHLSYFCHFYNQGVVKCKHWIYCDWIILHDDINMLEDFICIALF